MVFSLKFLAVEKRKKIPNEEASTIFASGGDICKASLFVATCSKLWVNVDRSDESLELQKINK